MSAFLVIGSGETLTIGFNWDDQDWLGTETISSSSWTIGPSGPTLSASANNTTTTSVKVSGCTYGQQYTLRNTVGTSGSQTGVREIQLRCTDSP
jgi:hypothetical protein